VFQELRAVRLICVAAAAAAVWLTGGVRLAAQATTSKTSSTSRSSATKSSVTTPATTTAAKPATAKTSSAAAARARRARQAKARAEAAARALAEAQQPRFKLDDSGVEIPDVRAEAAIIYNPDNGDVLFESNSQNQRSIASITKVMTALVYLGDEPDLTRKVTIITGDVRGASTTLLKAGYTVTAGDLLHLTLIASDNAAARALARISPGGTPAFIERMNRKAQELGLSSTSYVDSSGLLAANVSSAYDMARLISHVSAEERIAGIMRLPEYTFTSGRRTIQARNTNQLVTGGDVDVQAGKTGFITKAGYCLATLLRLPEGGPRVAVVVLGAKSNVGRFWETRHLLSWIRGKASELLGGPSASAHTLVLAPIPAS
jgi:D-alanyl-D-alanine endopeptidase (penicillin-binding protein 7)